MLALEVKNLSKTYKEKGKEVKALNNISFNIKEKEIFGLLGPNGAGKTTTINILSGVLIKDKGEIKYFGKELNEDIKNQINFASAYDDLTRDLTVYQNIKIFGKIYNVKDIDNKIISLLKTFQILDIKDRKVHSLSTGQKSRLNLCKGLINNPKLLLLDEATVGLDPDIADIVRNNIKNLNTTILFTSHNMDEVEQLCNRIAFLSNGKILKIDTPDNIKKLIKEQIVIIDFYPATKSIEKALQDLKLKIISIENNKAIISVNNAKEKIDYILHPLFKKGFRIKDLAIEKPKLQDVFIKVARGELWRYTGLMPCC